MSPKMNFFSSAKDSKYSCSSYSVTHSLSSVAVLNENN